MSPISATRVIAVSLPIPGRTISAWTQSGDLALQPGDRGGQGVEQPAAVLDDRAGVAGRARLASQARPGPVHRLERSEIPRSASTAWTRLFSEVDRRTRLARWRSNARRSRVAWGAIQASGSRSARSSWASGRASTLSFFSRAEGDRLAAAGVDQVRFQLEFLQQLHQPAPAVGGLEGHWGARRKGAQDRYQLGRIVGDVAVALLLAGLINHGDLGALAMHVHADVPTHVGLLPRARRSPKPRLSGRAGDGGPTHIASGQHHCAATPSSSAGLASVAWGRTGAASPFSATAKHSSIAARTRPSISRASSAGRPAHGAPSRLPAAC